METRFITSYKIISLTLAVFAAGSAAFAEGASPTSEAPESASSTAAVATPKTDGDEVICKTSEATGTRLGAKKTCFTRDQWAQLSAQSYAAVNHMQMQFESPR